MSATEYDASTDIMANRAEWIARMVRGKETEDISLRELAILMQLHLRKHDQMLMASWATDLRISRAAVCRAFKALEGLGLVFCQKNPDDKRKIVITITKKGRELVVSGGRK